MTLPLTPNSPDSLVTFVGNFRFREILDQPWSFPDRWKIQFQHTGDKGTDMFRARDLLINDLSRLAKMHGWENYTIVSIHKNNPQCEEGRLQRTITREQLENVNRIP